ncbi:MAG: hypothetical protein DIZ80_04725 [endosymbiont of Galathealinum brachiosum]|uniref:Uncharacterized protein n=1 Tax=endosymbiont of Galathealinum brachiosum TaxID=2200906 RepID=A0A370DK61_9GAMM|nr:MAG: hypothetical protein DIZ80_04725 [endosymbiont of Galathealinum brachiosum]
MRVLIIYIISLLAYVFFVGHIVVFIVGFVFAMPYEWLSDSDEYDSDEENFLYLMKIVLGVATLGCATYFGWKDLYHLQSGDSDSVIAVTVNLVFMIIVFIRLKLIFEGKA